MWGLVVVGSALVVGGLVVGGLVAFAPGAAVATGGGAALHAYAAERKRAVWLDSVGEALAAGHLRFVSLHAAEAGPLEAAGASGALEPPESDLVMATVQNLGADKLDFHATRAIEHSCDVTNEAYAECVTKMTLRNDAPSGLPRYVAPNDPYGIMKSFAEIYVPGEAEVRGVFRGDVPIDYSQGKQDGLVAFGVRMEIERGEEDTLSVLWHETQRSPFL